MEYRSPGKVPILHHILWLKSETLGLIRYHSTASSTLTNKLEMFITQFEFLQPLV